MISVRLTEEEFARLTAEAEAADLDVSQLMQSWSLETPDRINQQYRELKEAVALVLAKF
jgi:hypothetical protein